MLTEQQGGMEEAAEAAHAERSTVGRWWEVGQDETGGDCREI